MGLLGGITAFRSLACRHGFGIFFSGTIPWRIYGEDHWYFPWQLLAGAFDRVLGAPFVTSGLSLKVFFEKEKFRYRKLINPSGIGQAKELYLFLSAQVGREEMFSRAGIQPLCRLMAALAVGFVLIPWLPEPFSIGASVFMAC